jgi:putative membrane protein
VFELLTFANTLPIASHDGWDGPGPWLLLAPLFWITVVLLVVWLVRGRGWRGWGPPRGPGAREILDRRFAEGEISAEEYRTRRQTLADERR